MTNSLAKSKVCLFLKLREFTFLCLIEYVFFFELPELLILSIGTWSEISVDYNLLNNSTW